MYEINKTGPKFLFFFDKNRNKNDLPCVCVVFFTVFSLLDPFGSCLIDVLDFELH